MNSLLSTLLSFVALVVTAPLSIGIVRKCKARFQNRVGASIFQPYYALASLCRKEMTITKRSSWVFRAVPFVVLGSALALALFIPALGSGSWVAERTSIFLIAATLAIGSLFLVFGGMDVASAFGGMGSSREMTLAALVEPAIVLVLVTFSLATNAWNMDGMIGAFALTGWYATRPFLIVSLVSLAFVCLAENARYPVDNPATHLELTMVHEAMILEYSGPYLAMLEMASAIKFVVLGTLFMNILFPFGLVTAASGIGSVLLAVIFFLAKVFLVSFFVAFLESTIAKMRFYRMQEYMATAYAFALAGFLLVVTFATR